MSEQIRRHRRDVVRPLRRARRYHSCDNSVIVRVRDVAVAVVAGRRTLPDEEMVVGAGARTRPNALAGSKRLPMVVFALGIDDPAAERIRLVAPAAAEIGEPLISRRIGRMPELDVDVRLGAVDVSGIDELLPRRGRFKICQFLIERVLVVQGVGNDTLAGHALHGELVAVEVDCRAVEDQLPVDGDVFGQFRIGTYGMVAVNRLGERRRGRQRGADCGRDKRGADACAPFRFGAAESPL